MLVRTPYTGDEGWNPDLPSVEVVHGIPIV